MQFSTLLLSPVIFASGISSAPVASPGAVDINCFFSETSYSITSQVSYVADPRLVTGVSINGCDGCSITETSEYSVSVTIAVGANLDVGEIVGLGINAQVSISTTSGESIGATLACPAGAKCGLLARPTLYRIQGFKTKKDHKCHRQVTTPYDMSLPVLVQGASPAAAAKVEYSACFTANGRPVKPVKGFDYPDCPAASESH